MDSDCPARASGRGTVPDRDLGSRARAGGSTHESVPDQFQRKLKFLTWLDLESGPASHRPQDRDRPPRHTASPLQDRPHTASLLRDQPSDT